MTRILFSVILLVAFSSGLKISSKVGNVIVKEEGSKTLWCASDSPYSTCNWELPDGKVCKFGENEDTTCKADSEIRYTESDHNCSIVVDRLHEDQSGTWRCVLSDGFQPFSGSVEVIAAVQPNVEFVGVFGTVTVLLGQPMVFQCIAAQGRPVGNFSWYVGGDGKPDIQLKNENYPVIKNSENGYVTVSEKFTYTPNVEHQERNLYCAYVQKDENGLEISRTEDRISLSIFYVDDPIQEIVTIPPVTQGHDLVINMEFGAHPKPDPKDVTWVISSQVETTKITTFDTEATTIDNYVALPLEDIAENRYRATFVIKDIDIAEEEKEHSLEIKARPYKDKDPIEIKTYRFSISVSPHNEQGGGDQEDRVSEETTTTNVAMIVSIVVVLLIMLIAGGMVFFSWYFKKWCFAPAEPKSDPETEAALDEGTPNMRPILKHKYSRPS